MSNILTPAKKRVFPARPPLEDRTFKIVPFDELGRSIATVNEASLTLPWIRKEGDSYEIEAKVDTWEVTATVACQGSGKCYGVRLVDEVGAVAFKGEFPNWCAFGPTIPDIEFTFSVAKP